MRYWTLTFFVVFGASCKMRQQLAGAKDTSIPVDSNVTEGAKVDLLCKNSNARAAVELRILENGQVQPNAVPQSVPSIFIEELTEDHFYIREFTITGSATATDPLSGNGHYQESFESRKMYGSLGYTEPSEGFGRLAIYGDYERFLFRAISIEYNSIREKNRIQLYFAGDDGGATNFPLSCEGTMPDLPAARLPQPLVEPYHRMFNCNVAERGQIAATTFSFKVRNLHKPRIMQAIVEGEDINQNPIWIMGNIGEHQVNLFNEYDSGLTYRGTENNMTLDLYGDSDGVATSNLSFSFPKRETTEVSGRFKYRQSGSGQLWANVSCVVSPFDP